MEEFRYFRLNAKFMRCLEQHILNATQWFHWQSFLAHKIPKASQGLSRCLRSVLNLWFVFGVLRAISSLSHVLHGIVIYAWYSNMRTRIFREDPRLSRKVRYIERVFSFGDGILVRYIKKFVIPRVGTITKTLAKIRGFVASSLYREVRYTEGTLYRELTVTAFGPVLVNVLALQRNEPRARMRTPAVGIYEKLFN